MAGKAKSKQPAAKRAPFRPHRWIRRWVLRTISVAFLIMAFAVILFSVFNPPKTLYMRQESARLGGIDHVWVPMDHIAPVMARAAVAAEDANFCQHWGFDVAAIKAAMAEGGTRGASTISQQVVKNVYLWHGRNWARKLLEAAITPLVEAVWSKRRILEVYLNVAEFDEGVFGVEAAARHYFGVGPGQLTPTQAARLAMVLPNPKERSASKPTAGLRKRSASILDGAATIERDGRAACFQ
ncbi:monofunctional biosynthetic peptidoglycan transglycosylase [Marinovum sp.]|uniref:monofunctional biosynthetic peptidoglycan transglycosylase n=1 Tax=Marinovum sp. TaxID=2024839 RepID=UPI002B267A5E|nr:monofunctional biosynthetic peptidoglycan transglycosylase [Marinovum sp.]